MSKLDSAVELDFFGMENQAAAVAAKPPQAPKLFERRRSFRDIQHAISKINPEVVKNVIASASANSKEEQQRLFPALPVYAPASRTTTVSSAENDGGETAPLTIFYDGTVSVFDVRRLEAEKIIKLIQQESLFKTADSADSNLANTDGDLPLQRRKSLQRFLEKRRSRLVMVSPYGSPSE
ncbi:PREDICTED: protein TIFY 9-like isoform X2 [Ipomoea nil]|uniref:protein TIFY 9-like isoform X2 n=1 Tax=Ipomoea nil TaxID=35883 RepID=UPI000901A383|nr:PREDICTED: protein TIFY 9-like isoform X2 [Ipomoea nil]